jgi:sporulation and spore germination protein
MSNSTRRQERGASALARHGRRAALVVALSLVALIVAACGAATSPGADATPTATAAEATVKVYFSKSPESDSNPAAVFAVSRTVSSADPLTAALEEVMKGPTTAEQAQGYYSALSGALALISTCSGEFRDFDLTYDHRGPTPQPGTLTFQFCRRVDIRGDLDGPRIQAMIRQTAMRFSQIKDIVILNQNGGCFDDLQGANACLGGTPSGYKVDVYFSRHPDSDNRPAAVFPVHRTSPTLGVATYAMSQLLAGPTATEVGSGYFTPLQGALSGASACGGADFTITLNQNRDHPEAGTATLRFCRDVKGLGDSGAAMARNEIHATLTQFPSIKKVVIVYKDGSCFDDLIGCG